MLPFLCRNRWHIALYLVCTSSLIAVARKQPSLKPCPASVQQTQACAPCSLQQWAEKIATLKERPIQFSSLPSKKAYQKNILTFQEFMSTIQKCAKTIASACKKDAQWLKKKSLATMYPEIFNLNRLFTYPIDTPKNFTFKPYTQRLLVKPGTMCALFGDLHGSVHSLMRDLKLLKKEGYLDDEFKIQKNDFTIIFLGDYIDRGIYGVEVMYTIARLKIANPSQVLLIRGNHEDYLLAPDFRKKHTKEEEKDNTPSFIDELYRKFDLTEKDEVAIFRLYETLPQVLYLGCGSAEHKDYMMCCHGGLELGYDPYCLLHAQKNVSFELIETLWRKKHFTKKLTRQFQDSIKLNFSIDALCGELQDFAPLAPFYKITPHHSTYIGFMWNDFYVDPTKKVGTRGKKFTGWVYGKQLTKTVLAWSSSKKVTLQGIFRAHQHNNDTGGPMLNLLCCKKGLLSVWEHEHIYTLLSAPDSKLEDTGQECFTYDSFILLTTAEKFSDWQITHKYADAALQATWMQNSYKKHDLVPKAVATAC